MALCARGCVMCVCRKLFIRCAYLSIANEILDEKNGEHKKGLAHTFNWTDVKNSFKSVVFIETFFFLAFVLFHSNFDGYTVQFLVSALIRLY